ncbi:MAG: GNAT family N-acetyltransferase [Anaerolineae bacterium]|nr:GNAT family N-acetyltransferase [Anaerolineae bacterium]
MIVERATEDDLVGVIGVDAAHGSQASMGAPRAEYLTEAIRKRQCYIAREGWDVLGFAVLTREFFGQYFVDLLVVHPDHRRKGIARALMQHIERIVPEEKLFTSTNQSNAPMQALCEKLGFVRSGWIENLDEGDPEIVYFKRFTRET